VNRQVRFLQQPDARDSSEREFMPDGIADRMQRHGGNDAAEKRFEVGRAADRGILTPKRLDQPFDPVHMRGTV